MKERSIIFMLISTLVSCSLSKKNDAGQMINHKKGGDTTNLIYYYIDGIKMEGKAGTAKDDSRKIKKIETKIRGKYKSK